MTLVVGNATHLHGKALTGAPQPGDVYRYDGAAFVTHEGLTRMEPEVARNAKNIQLLILQQANHHAMAVGLSVDGFFDTFEDETGLDTVRMVGEYVAANGLVASPDPPGTHIAHGFRHHDFEYQDVKGTIAYWKQDSGGTGHFEGAEAGFTVGSATSSESGGTMTGFPASSHGLEPGDVVRFYGFTESSFNTLHTVHASSTPDKIVIAVAYVAETLTSDHKRRKVMTLGTGAECPGVEEGLAVTLQDRVPVHIDDIDGAIKGAGIGKVRLTSKVASRNTACISPLHVKGFALTPTTTLTEVHATGSRSYTPPPAKRNISAEVVVPHMRKIYTICGVYNTNPGTGILAPGDIWEYDIDAGTFEQIVPTGDPVVNVVHGFARYIPEYGKILYMGIRVNPNFTFPVPPRVGMGWFDPVNRTHTEITPVAYPIATNRRGWDYDPTTGRVWSFGGDAEGFDYSDRLCYYDIEANTWVEMAKGGTWPPARLRQSLVYEPGHSLLTYGGISSTGAFMNDFWRYDIVQGTWEQLTPGGYVMPPLANAFHCFVPELGRWYIWGGMTTGSVRTSGLSYYDVSRNSWTSVSYSGTQHTLSHGTRQSIELVDGKMYVYSRVSNVELNDVIWMHLYDETVPDRTGVAVTTGSGAVDTSECIRVQVSSVSETKGEGASIYYAVSWDSKETWKVFSGGVWIDIAKNEGGTWKYRDAEGGYQVADANTQFGALKQAIAVIGNRMTGDHVTAIGTAQWNAAAVRASPSAAVHLGAVLVSREGGTARVYGWEIDRTEGLDVRSVVMGGEEQLYAIGGSVLAKGNTDTLKVYAARSGGAEWTELDGLRKGAVLAGDVEVWGGDLTELRGSESGVVLRARKEGDGELHGWAANWVPVSRE